MKANELLKEYINTMHIDNFAIPVQGSGKIGVLIIDAQDFYKTVTIDGCPLVNVAKGEEFYRLNRTLTVTKILPIFRNCKKSLIWIDSIAKLGEIPKHCNSVARGFEVVTAQAVNGLHTGDNIAQIDVISDIYGRIECKTGKGRLYTAAALDD